MEDAGEEVPALDSMPVLFNDLAELLRCYMVIRRSKGPDFAGLPSITIGDIGECYRTYHLSEWIDTREFAGLMFDMDTVTLEHYKALHPSKT